MTIEELLDEMDSDVVEGYPRDVKKVAALHAAVIREASVGRIKVVLVDVRNPILPEYSHIDPRIAIRWEENHQPFDILKSDLLLIPISKEQF